MAERKKRLSWKWSKKAFHEHTDVRAQQRSRYLAENISTTAFRRLQQTQWPSSCDEATEAFDEPFADESGYIAHFHLNNKVGFPRRVYVGFIVKEIGELNERSGLWEVEFLMRARWCDPCLVGANQGADEPFTRKGEQYASLWEPDLEINNAGPNLVDLYADLPDTAWALKDPNTGLLSKTSRFRGTVRVGVNIRHFPFDEQCLHVEVTPTTSSLGKVILVPDPTMPLLKTPISPLVLTDEKGWRSTGTRENLSLTAGWKRSGAGTPWSTISLRIPLAREHAWYLWKVLYVEVFIVAWSTSVFALSPSAFSDRIQILLTLFLTLVALLITVNDALPRVGYLTVFDSFTIAVCALLLFAGAESLCVFILHQSGQVGWAAGLDRAAAIACFVMLVGFVVHEVQLETRWGKKLPYMRTLEWLCPGGRTRRRMHENPPDGSAAQGQRSKIKSN